PATCGGGGSQSHVLSTTTVRFHAATTPGECLLPGRPAVQVEARDPGTSREMSTLHRRRPFEGVWHIVQFNWPFYLAAAVVIAALLVAAALFRGSALLFAITLVGAAVAAWLT